MTNILYLTVVEDLKEKIVKGLLKPGDMLKSEAEMMKEYAVSRMTLRKGLSLLANAGYIYSVPGKGYFVREPETDLYQFRFHDYDSFDCPIDEIKLLSVRIEDMTAAFRELFKTRETSQQVVLERIAYWATTPVAAEVVYFPYLPNEPVVEEKLNFANYPGALEARHLFALRKELTVQVVEAPDKIKEKLRCREGEPVFLITKKVLRKDTGAVLSISKFYVRKEWYSLKAATPEEDESRRVY